MTEAKHFFTNTENNKSLRSLLSAFIGLVIFEWMLVVFLAWVLIPSTAIFLGVFTALVPLQLFVLRYMNRLLKSGHQIDEDGLLIQLGGHTSCKIPWEQIAEVIPAHDVKLPELDGLGCCLALEGATLYCLGNKHDLFRISLNVEMPLQGRIKRELRQCLVDTIYLNADDLDGILSAIKAKLDCGDKQKVQEAEVGISSAQDDLSPLFEQGQKSERCTKVPMLELRDLTYSYGKKSVVDQLSLRVMPGEIVAFLGPNGMGKSTTLNMIAGLIKPQSGSVLLKEGNIWLEAERPKRGEIGYVPDPPILYTRLTAREHLHYAASLYDLPKESGTEKINHLITLFQMEGWSDDLIQGYSQGMKRKVSLASVLLASPELLIIDELTNSFDALTISKIERILDSYRESGKSVLFTGHVLSAAEKLADRIYIMSKGRCVVFGTLEELKQQTNRDTLEELYFSVTGELR